MRYLVFLVYRVMVNISAALYQAEGINIPLRTMPTQLIGPTLRRYGAQIGHSVRFQAPLTIHNAALRPAPFYHHLSVGNDCYLGRELFLDLQDEITIKDNVTISHRVMILTHTDVGESPLKETLFPSSQAPVTIHRGAYIGAGAMILQGVEIGEATAIGAGAIVVDSIPPRTVAVGAPARVIKRLVEPGIEQPSSASRLCKGE